MAAATADREGQYQEYKLKAHPVQTNVHIFKETLVMYSADGYLVPGADTAGLLFAGVAFEQADNNPGAAGAIKCRVRKSGEFEFAFGAGNAAQSMLGDPVCATDDQTVDLAATTTNDIQVGHISEIISATKVRVNITQSTR